MKTVRVTFRLDCSWELIPPAYRIYFNDELLSERNYIWINTEETLEENFFVNVEPGQHQITIRTLEPHSGHFTINNLIYDSAIDEDLSDISIRCRVDK